MSLVEGWFLRHWDPQFTVNDGKQLPSFVSIEHVRLKVNDKLEITLISSLLTPVGSS